MVLARSEVAQMKGVGMKLLQTLLLLMGAVFLTAVVFGMF
jgi:hypothetical protein